MVGVFALLVPKTALKLGTVAWLVAQSVLALVASLSRRKMQSLVSGLQGPSDTEKMAAMQKLEELQVKDTLRMINNMVELCFSECVSGFRSKALTWPEEKCVNTCAEKFLKHSGRVGQRFGELWMAEQAAQAEAAGQSMPGQ